MHDRPSAEELLEAVRRFLADDVVSALDGHLKYQARVAANVVAIVAREMACEEQQLADEWQRLAEIFDESGPRPAERSAQRLAVEKWTLALTERIRAGDADEGPWRAAVFAHLKRTVSDKLTVAKGQAEDG